MNIQLPIILWTIICFLILMAVLRNLLFKPVLKLLDDRKKKLQDAENKLKEENALFEEHKKRLAIIEEDAKIQRDNYIKSELEIIRVKTKDEIEKAKADRLKNTEEYKLQTEDEKKKVIEVYNKSSEEIVKAFADRLTLSE